MEGGAASRAHLPALPGIAAGSGVAAMAEASVAGELGLLGELPAELGGVPKVSRCHIVTHA